MSITCAQAQSTLFEKSSFALFGPVLLDRGFESNRPRQDATSKSLTLHNIMEEARAELRL